MPGPGSTALRAGRRSGLRAVVVAGGVGMQDGVEYLGRCHCGALEARYRTALPTVNWAVRTCQCSFCQAHQALYATDAAGLLQFETAEESLLQNYRFGLRQADFRLCRRCGIYVGAVYAEGERRVGILNLRILRPLPTDLAAPAPMNFDGESEGARTARWAARWTPLAEGSA